MKLYIQKSFWSGVGDDYAPHIEENCYNLALKEKIFLQNDSEKIYFIIEYIKDNEVGISFNTSLIQGEDGMLSTIKNENFILKPNVNLTLRTPGMSAGDFYSLKLK